MTISSFNDDHHVDASNMDSVYSDEYEREEEKAVLSGKEEEVILRKFSSDVRLEAMKTLRKSTIVLERSKTLRNVNAVDDCEMVKIDSSFKSSLEQGTTSSLDRDIIEFAFDEYLFRTEDVESDDNKSSAIWGTIRYKVGNFCCKTRGREVFWKYVCVCIHLAVFGNIVLVVFSHGSNRTSALVSETSLNSSKVFTSNVTSVPSYPHSSNTPSARTAPPPINAASDPTAPPTTNPASRPTAPPTTNPISPTTVSLEDYNYYLTDVPSSAYIPPNTPSTTNPTSPPTVFCSEHHKQQMKKHHHPTVSPSPSTKHYKHKWENRLPTVSPSPSTKHHKHKLENCLPTVSFSFNG